MEVGIHYSSQQVVVVVVVVVVALVLVLVLVLRVVLVSAPQDPQSAAPVTKSALQGRACHDICTSRFTAIHRKSTSKDNVKMPKRSCCSRLPPISENQPPVQQPRFTAPATKPVHTEDHHIQSTAPAMKSAHRHRTTPTTRGQSRRAPARAHQILRARAAEMHFGDLEVNVPCCK